jgi:hypothetical protein
MDELDQLRLENARLRGQVEALERVIAAMRPPTLELERVVVAMREGLSHCAQISLAGDPLLMRIG